MTPSATALRAARRHHPGIAVTFCLKLAASLGFCPELVPLLMIPLADKFNGPAALGSIAIKSENLSDHARPASIDQSSKRLILVIRIDVVAIEESAWNVAFSTCRASDELLELLNSRKIFGAISRNLTSHLGGTVIFVFFHQDLFLDYIL